MQIIIHKGSNNPKHAISKDIQPTHDAVVAVITEAMAASPTFRRNLAEVEAGVLKITVSDQPARFGHPAVNDLGWEAMYPVYVGGRTFAHCDQAVEEKT